MTTQLAAELALQMVIMDAIEKGKISDASDATAYMGSETCIQAAKRYSDMILAEYNK